MTNYRILKRLRDGSLVQGKDYETNGPEQAMKRAAKSVDGVVDMPVALGETLVAVPVGNWTEQGAREKLVSTIELFDPGEAPTAVPVPDDDGEPT